MIDEAGWNDILHSSGESGHWTATAASFAMAMTKMRDDLAVRRNVEFAQFASGARGHRAGNA